MSNNDSEEERPLSDEERTLHNLQACVFITKHAGLMSNDEEEEALDFLSNLLEKEKARSDREYEDRNYKPNCGCC